MSVAPRTMSPPPLPLPTPCTCCPTHSSLRAPRGSARVHTCALARSHAFQCKQERWQANVTAGRCSRAALFRSSYPQASAHKHPPASTHLLAPKHKHPRTSTHPRAPTRALACEHTHLSPLHSHKISQDLTRSHEMLTRCSRDAQEMLTRCPRDAHEMLTRSHEMLTRCSHGRACTHKVP